MPSVFISPFTEGLKELLAHKKITATITLITNVITKVDLLREKFSEDKETKETLDKILNKYQNQKRKVLNLRNAWDRVFNNEKSNPEENNRKR